MKPFLLHTGLVVPIDRANIDTDAIVPKQFLKKVAKAGFGKHLFHDWRYLNDDEKKPNSDFILNKPEYKGSTILLARDNFGCGSSREHAPWALADFGFRVIVAPSFADIFYNNCLRNGFLLVRLKAEEVDELFRLALKGRGVKITADLQRQKVIAPDGKEFSFNIDAFAKECLLKGLDAIGWTEQFMDEINDYEKNLKTEKPWI
ncbi:MAG: 3-isopropylmalate dehydratase small subunit [Candidatus Omnitrophica bacterium]|nr:3-isopropylmalate dehydratase small subunit [Candidatus Omnitrophota bacterium]